ncbi:hypothetical protein DI09_22p10, partial [Mitosporidium daphniae]
PVGPCDDSSSVESFNDSSKIGSFNDSSSVESCNDSSKIGFSDLLSEVCSSVLTCNEGRTRKATNAVRNKSLRAFIEVDRLVKNLPSFYRLFCTVNFASNKNIVLNNCPFEQLKS